MRRTIYLTEDDAGAALDLSVGDSVEVTLSEESGQGRWVAQVTGDALRPDQATEHGFFLLTEEGHSVVHRFHAVAEGQAVLELAYRNAHSQSGDARKFRVGLTVGNPPPLKRARIVVEPARVSQLAVWVFTALLMCVMVLLAGVRMVMLGQNFETADIWVGVGLSVAAALLAVIFAARLMNVLIHLSDRDGSRK